MSKRDETTRPSATEAPQEDAFLSRWARRKRVARSGGDPDAGHPNDAPAQPGDLAARLEEAPEAGDATQEDGAEETPVLTDADMPPVDSIDENTDMSGFFSSGVSQTLRKAALRKFFHSQAFNIVDGLDDYDDDFRTFEALGDIVTSDMRGRMELEERRARESLAEKGEGAETGATEPASESDAEEDRAARAASDDMHAPQEEGSQTSEASAEPAPGITRDPSRQARSAPAKLRPRAERDGDGDEDAVGEGEDA